MLCFTDEREQEMTTKLKLTAVKADNSGDDDDSIGPAAPSAFKASFKPATKPVSQSDQSSEEDDVIGPPIPSSIKKSSTSPDDDGIGPPIPTDILEKMKGERNTEETGEVNEDSSDEEYDVII
jgi:hypothetical protein